MSEGTKVRFECGMRRPAQRAVRPTGNVEWMRGATARRWLACFEEGGYYSSPVVTSISGGQLLDARACEVQPGTKRT
jgi:hypothetical protein